MPNVKTNSWIKRTLDAVMIALLLCLMAYQVAGEAAHEWFGVGMVALAAVHQILNRKWYGALFRGKYGAFRTVSTVLNVLLILSFALTAFCGMSMSSHATPFLYGAASVSFARRAHLSMSYWTFVLMGIHLGTHLPAITAGLKLKERTKAVLAGVFACIGGVGLWLAVRNGVQNYLFFRVPFAFLDYEKAAWLVYLEHLLTLSFWALIGTQTARICMNAGQKTDRKKNPLFPVAVITAAAAVGIALAFLFPASDGAASFGTADWSVPQTEAAPEQAPDESGNVSHEDAAPAKLSGGSVDDGFAPVQGGSFLMGSPKTENWRIEDETQRQVTVGPFFIDPYEATQGDYVRLTGKNPSAFTGENLPVENISWLDAVLYANAKSADAGLTPVYTVAADGVTWDLSADGYRLPTEAEWEYACRAGVGAPFNTKKSLSAAEANFYGHYPYEIEENYFDNSVLEAKPGEYRQKTLPVGSFKPNAWGLYDMHGNVNEWCWDYYGDYDPAAVDRPTGPASGTRHVYRGGGWNDFAKNMRSAYRAAGQEDMRSFNLGVRLVRNADGGRSGSVTAGKPNLRAQTGGKVLIAYFSWGGNTRGVAKEIQAQTGADLFEITPRRPYSSDYNTVLTEAQEDQHKHARPKLSEHVKNFDEYGVVLLGYPNWWASIPAPVATFLEEYDFSGKTIVPFCSHGGGRFGQSLTAVAKLAPNAVIGEGLSVHYSGGSTLSRDVAAWLKVNGVKAR